MKAITPVLLCIASVTLASAQTGSAVSSNPATATTTASQDSYEPIGTSGRFQWFAMSTVGPASLLGGTISSGWGTLYNSPREYGTHWTGFGERYGMRLTGVSVSNAMEASLGAAWGEDPRYIRDAGAPFKNGIGHVMKMTFLAQNREGRAMPAYARYMAITGSNFLSNAWRPDSDATVARASARTLLGFLARMSSNAWDEFWPDVKAKLFHKGPTD